MIPTNLMNYPLSIKNNLSEKLRILSEVSFNLLQNQMLDEALDGKSCNSIKIIDGLLISELYKMFYKDLILSKKIELKQLVSKYDLCNKLKCYVNSISHSEKDKLFNLYGLYNNVNTTINICNDYYITFDSSNLLIEDYMVLDNNKNIFKSLNTSIPTTSNDVLAMDDIAYMIDNTEIDTLIPMGTTSINIAIPTIYVSTFTINDLFGDITSVFSTSTVIVDFNGVDTSFTIFRYVPSIAYPTSVLYKLKIQ